MTTSGTHAADSNRAGDKLALDYADARERRKPTSEIKWNGATIGDLRRRSLDLAGSKPLAGVRPEGP